MFERFKIKQKITLVPIITSIAFLLVVVVLVLVGGSIKNVSIQIQTHYYPLLELTQKMEDDFNSLQRGLQDAVATEDSLEIYKTKYIYDILYSNIKRASKTYPDAEADFIDLNNNLQDYYLIAQNVSYRLITQATDEELVRDLELMTDKYNGIKKTFSDNKVLYQGLIANQFEDLENMQNVSFLVIMITTISAVVLIGWISSVLIKSITKPLNEVEKVAYEVGLGNFEVQVKNITQDEFGLLKEAFRDMIIKIKFLLKAKDISLKRLKAEIKVREKAEQELNIHKNHLEELVNERTKALKKANLNLKKEIKVRKKAEEKQQQLIQKIENVNEELKNFAYIVSHDLKAPLRAIGSLSEWLRIDYSDKFDEEGLELIRLLDSRVKRMHNLIEGILQYSRVGRVLEEKVEVDLNTIVQNVIELVDVPEHINIHLDNELPRIKFEKTRIEQVFQNLIGNAIKYMDKPKGKINIGSISQNGKLNFYVSDNGPGIDEKYYDKVFQIFQTLNSRDNFESTGVGLSLVRKIIEMYGGKIWIDSEIGKGCKFEFNLPKKLLINSMEEGR